MSEENEWPGRPRGSGLRGFGLIAVALVLALAAGFGVNMYLKWRLVEMGAGEQRLHGDWMFIDAADTDLVAEGRWIYEANCANCHGYRLEGQPNWKQRGDDGLLPAPPHDESGHSWHHADAVLFAIVKLGGQAFMPQGIKSGMPAYKDILGDREIEAALAYIKSHWPDRIVRLQKIRTNRSRGPDQ